MRLTDSDRELIARLNQPAPVGAAYGVTDYLYELYLKRPDLKALFPDLDRDGQAYVEWVLQHGRHELSIHELLLPPAPAEFRYFLGAPDRPAPLSGQRWGVNVVGHLASDTGIGEACRGLIRALRAVDVPVIPIEALPQVQAVGETHFPTLPPASAGFPISILCTNPDFVTMMRPLAGDDFFDRRYTVGYWWRELISEMPIEWRLDAHVYDEAWAGSRHNADCLRPFIDIPVHVMPSPVEVPAPPRRAREQLSLPNGFLFLFVGNYGSVVERKNPIGVAQAFIRAFEPGEGAKLVIKVSDTIADPLYHAELLTLVRQHPDITLVEGLLPGPDKDAMLAACDCYVALHRAEGFGFPLAEAMYLGKPVIATGYSGNLDFMNERNSHLVPFTLEPIGRDLWPYRAETQWAEPNLDEAARMMRAVFEDRDAARELGRVAAEDIRRTHSVARCGELMAQRLEQITEQIGIHRPRPGVRSVDPAPAAAVLERGPLPPPRSAAGRLGPWARRAALRAMKPYTVHERALDEQLLAALERSDEAVTQLGQWLAAVSDRLDALELRLANATAQNHAAAPATATADVEERLAELERRLDRSQALEHGALRLEQFDAGPAGTVIGYQTDRPEEETGRILWEATRPEPTAEETRERLRSLMPVLSAHSPVVHLGCGRGELLGMLAEAGVEARGVEDDPQLVELCQGKGLDVELADPLDYLDRIGDGTVGAVVGAGLVEQLDSASLIGLIAAAHAALRSGGLMVLEASNPYAPQPFFSQHELVFPETLLSLCRQRGFATGYIWYPHGAGDPDRDREEQVRYAVVAQAALRPPIHDAVNLVTDVGELWYPGSCRVLTPAVRYAGSWDAPDADGIREVLSPGMTVINAGAHVGYFTVLAARCVGPSGHVLAIEPAPENYELLRANVERNGLRNVTVEHAAVWHEPGELELWLSETNTGDHRVFRPDERTEHVRVPAVRIDDLVGAGGRVDLVVIDTQGSELRVLQGMERTLAEARPVVHLEFWPVALREAGSDPRELVELAHGLGFELTVLGMTTELDYEQLLATAGASPGGFCTVVLSPRAP